MKLLKDNIEQWREEMQGYEILAELPVNWSVKQAESFVKFGFAVPTRHGRAYLATENMEGS